MPNHSGAEFKFDLAAPPDWAYDPGGTIIGNLMRYAPIDSPQATVELALVGRSQATEKLEHKGKELPSPVTSTSHYTLFRGKPQRLFRGPLHLTEGSTEPLSFPFSVDIPLEPEAYAREGHSQPTSHLPLEGDHPGHHVLPGSFKHTGEQSYFNFKVAATYVCSVEYSLEATMEYQSPTRQIWKASYPITIRYPPGDEVNRYVQRKATAKGRVRSHMLLPTVKKHGLSLKQRTLKTFRSSSMPEFHYQVEMMLPVAIQIGDPQPFQATLSIKPLPEESSPIIRKDPQKIQIKWMELILECYADVLVDHDPDRILSCWSFPIEGPPEGLPIYHTLILKDAIQNLGYPLVVSTGEDSEPLPIGDILQLRLRSGGMTSGRQYFAEANCLFPDFTTYNINARHSWRWKIGLSIEGQSDEVTVQSPVQLLRAA